MAEQQNVTASLGCGTLILIAIIVLVFGGRSDHEELEERIDTLIVEVQGMREDIEELKEALPKP